ncbi:MAG: SLBB domain-containing protein, partial [Gemmatimonadota bacterium]
MRCLGILLLTALVAGPTAAHAQDPETLRRRAEQLLGRPISDTEILQWLRQSGLTPEEIRGALEARGFDRAAADAYLEVLEGRVGEVPEGADPTAVLGILGSLQPPGLPEMPGGLGLVPSTRGEREDSVAAMGPPIFGREMFSGATSQFIPVTTGPVPPDYRLGPGDEIVLALSGEVEAAYEIPVTREGWILIPDVGRVYVNGLTLGELEDLLFRRLGEVYSGIGPDVEATTFFNVSLGDLRTTQVYVMGEVEEPGAYTLSSLSTALTALYWAGGPTTGGSFRRIRVTRGGETVREIDLYDYLLRGDASQDIRLEQGDFVFVPTAANRVTMDGAIVRPALYELVDGEMLGDAIRFAGGFLPQADLRRVQIERVLPPSERGPGHYRAVVDVSLSALEDASAVPLRDGDRVTVFAVLEMALNQVTLSGAVWRPGTYGAEPGLRLWDLIERAGGLLPDVYEGRAQIQRLDESEYLRRLIPV